MEHIIAKRGGDQACEIEAGIAWALQQVQQNARRRVTLVLSAPRGEGGRLAKRRIFECHC